MCLPAFVSSRQNTTKRRSGTTRMIHVVIVQVCVSATPLGFVAKERLALLRMCSASETVLKLYMIVRLLRRFRSAKKGPIVYVAHFGKRSLLGSRDSSLHENTSFSDPPLLSWEPIDRRSGGPSLGVRSPSPPQCQNLLQNLLQNPPQNLPQNRPAPPIRCGVSPSGCVPHVRRNWG